jgi:hypothetical protein
MNRSGNLVPGLVFRTIQFWFGVPEPILELELAVLIHGTGYPCNTGLNLQQGRSNMMNLLPEGRKLADCCFENVAGCYYKRKLVPRRSLWIPKTKSHLREGIKWHIQKVRV